MLRFFRYLKSLFSNNKKETIITPAKEQKPTKYVARVVPNETQDIALHRSRNIPFVTELARQQTKTDDNYNHSVSSIINQSEINSTTNHNDLLLPSNPLTQFEHFINHDNHDRTTNHDVDYSRHNNHDYTPSHSDSSHSHHDYSPSHDSGSSYQSDSTSYDSGSSGGSDW